MVTSVEAARKTLNDLQTKLADTRQWQFEIETANKSVSFEAHTAGGEARERLDNLNAQAVGAAREAESLGAAISEAKLRLQAAVAAELDEQERAKAHRAIALCAAFQARGEALDRSITKFLESYRGLNADFLEISKVGYAPGSWPLVAVNMRNAMIARLMFTDLQIEHLPPNRRHSFEEVINGWASNVRARATARLNKDAPAKDEAA